MKIEPNDTLLENLFGYIVGSMVTIITSTLLLILLPNPLAIVLTLLLVVTSWLYLDYLREQHNKDAEEAMERDRQANFEEAMRHVNSNRQTGHRQSYGEWPDIYRK